MDTKYISEKLNLFANNFIDNLPSLLLSIIIFIIFYVIAEYYKSIILPPNNKSIKSEIKLEQKYNIPYTDLIYYQLSWMIYYSIIIFGLLVSLVNLGFNVATIITLLFSIGFAVGLALQDTLKNIIAGIYIGINKLFKIGDIISLKLLGNLNPTYGRIIDYSLFYTTIIDDKNIISLIPNSMIQTNILSNISLS
jgi:small conductance mechanosensitive channel